MPTKTGVPFCLIWEPLLSSAMTTVFLGYNTPEGWSSLVGPYLQMELTHISVQPYLPAEEVQLTLLSGLILRPPT